MLSYDDLLAWFKKIIVVVFQLAHGADTCAKDINDMIPLMIASAEGHDIIIKNLIHGCVNNGQSGLKLYR